MDGFFRLDRDHVKPASLNRLRLTRPQTAEVRNALAVACGAVAVCAFALRNGLLSGAALDVASMELDVDEFIWASFCLSIPTALLAQRYHGPMRLFRSADDEEADWVA